MAILVTTLFVGDEDETDVLAQVTAGLNVQSTLLDYNAGGNPTYRFEGSDGDITILGIRVDAED